MAWKVRMPDGRIVAGGSLFPNQEGEWIWLDGELHGLMLRIAALLEERMAETERRDAVSVRFSSVEDFD